MELLYYFLHLVITQVCAESLPQARTTLIAENTEVPTLQELVYMKIIVSILEPEFSSIRRPKEVLCGWEGFRDHFRETATGDTLAKVHLHVLVHTVTSIMYSPF